MCVLDRHQRVFVVSSVAVDGFSKPAHSNRLGNYLYAHSSLTIHPMAAYSSGSMIIAEGLVDAAFRTGLDHRHIALSRPGKVVFRMTRREESRTKGPRNLWYIYAEDRVNLFPHLVISCNARLWV